MKLNLALILSIIVAVGIVAFGFTYFQISNERERLSNELEEKVNLIADRFLEANLPAIEKQPGLLTQDLVNKLLNQYRLLAITVYYNPDSIIFIGASANSLLQNSSDYIFQAATAGTTVGNFFTASGSKIYQLIKPVKTNDLLDKTIISYSKADYMLL
jgi:hypothetical protein